MLVFKEGFNFKTFRNVTCEVDIQPKSSDLEMHDDIIELLSNGEPTMFEKCLAPCFTTHIR